MPNAHENETPKTPTVHYGEVKILIKSLFSASADRYQTINIDCPLPSGLEWLEKALDRMKAAPDCQKEITKAARRLEHEMEEAFRRRQVDEHWGWGHIKNTMNTLELWERTRPKKSTVKNRRKRRKR
jgi:hypothetical protein